MFLLGTCAWTGSKKLMAPVNSHAGTEAILLGLDSATILDAVNMVR